MRRHQIQGEELPEIRTDLLEAPELHARVDVGDQLHPDGSRIAAEADVPDSMVPVPVGDVGDLEEHGALPNRQGLVLGQG